MSNESKDRLALRMQPDTRRKIEQWYQAADCRSMNEFVEKAVNFYADYLALNDSNALLPKSITAAIDGRLGMLEKNLSAISFEAMVELDMMAGIVAEYFEFTEDELRRRRAQSVRNVKQTNGLISLGKRARQKAEDEWLD
jgi:hypothetical protein